ncbi:MAG: hypothetical protein V4671_32840 [Armatimonadota bacterium]
MSSPETSGRQRVENMTRITLQGVFPPKGVVERGPTSLQDYLSEVK